MTQRHANVVIALSIVLVAAIVGIYLFSATSDAENQNDSIAGDSDAVATATPEPDDADAEPSPEPEPTPVPTPALELTTASGSVTHIETGEPLAQVRIDAVENGEVIASTESDAEGRYSLADLPLGSTLVFTLAAFATVEEPLDGRSELNIQLHPSGVSGRVVTADGQPIIEATVASGETLISTAEDGTFQIDIQDQQAEIIFKAPGFHAEVRPVAEMTGEDIVLQDKPVRALYATANTAGSDERLGQMLDMIDRTELNAIVIDIKDSAGYVFHDTSVHMAHDIGAVFPVYNAEHVLNQIRERGIYAIARIVIFEDPVLASSRPDLAIQDTQEGGLWETWGGLTWANPFREEVWDYNIALMQEAVDLGFDEIQLDYMRFPSDGPLNRAGYGQESTPESRDQAIASFLERSYAAIGPTRAYLTGDIFGLTLWDPGESGIGQNLVTVIERLDYVHPMIYPSHFYEGSMGFEIPNDHPYEVILLSLENGMQYIPEHYRPKVRPWLQDFSYGAGIRYGPDEVRAQIQATRDFGASGWMLWNAGNVYHEEALDP